MHLRVTKPRLPVRVAAQSPHKAHDNFRNESGPKTCPPCAGRISGLAGLPLPTRRSPFFLRMRSFPSVGQCARATPAQRATPRTVFQAFSTRRLTSSSSGCIPAPSRACMSATSFPLSCSATASESDAASVCERQASCLMGGAAPSHQANQSHMHSQRSAYFRRTEQHQSRPRKVPETMEAWSVMIADGSEGGATKRPICRTA